MRKTLFASLSVALLPLFANAYTCSCKVRDVYGNINGLPAQEQADAQVIWRVDPQNINITEGYDVTVGGVTLNGFNAPGFSIQQGDYKVDLRQQWVGKGLSTVTLYYTLDGKLVGTMRLGCTVPM